MCPRTAVGTSLGSAIRGGPGDSVVQPHQSRRVRAERAYGGKANAEQEHARHEPRAHRVAQEAGALATEGRAGWLRLPAPFCAPGSSLTHQRQRVEDTEIGESVMHRFSAHVKGFGEYHREVVRRDVRALRKDGDDFTLDELARHK